MQYRMEQEDNSPNPLVLICKGKVKVKGCNITKTAVQKKDVEWLSLDNLKYLCY